jgi:hypothetical protein
MPVLGKVARSATVAGLAILIMAGCGGSGGQGDGTATGAVDPTVTASSQVPDLQSDGFVTRAASYLQTHNATLTVDGVRVDRRIWATVMVAEAQHDGLAAFHAAMEAKKPPPLSDNPTMDMPNPGTARYAQKAAAALLLRHLLAVAAPKAHITVSAADVNAAVAQEQRVAASTPAQQLGLPPGADRSYFSSPAYRSAVKRLMLEGAMRRHVLATTAGDTDATKLATWARGRLNPHSISLTGVPGLDLSNLAADLA